MSDEIKLDKDDEEEIQENKNKIDKNNNINNNNNDSTKEQKDNNNNNNINNIKNNNNKNTIENINNNNSQNFTYQFIFKIILIGDTSTGKTSLINRYINKRFEDKYRCTIGVDFLMQKIYIDNTLIKLQIWDTAGMEKYKQITSSYYRGAQACIVVFDLTNIDSFYSLQQWVDDYCQISKNQNNIYIVGNKCDLNDFKVSKEDIMKFCQNNNGFKYLQTSAKTGEGVEKMFEDISNDLFEKYKNKIKGGNNLVYNQFNNNGKNDVINLSTAVNNENKIYKKNKKCCN